MDVVFCWQPVYLQLSLVSEAGRVVCCDDTLHVPLPLALPIVVDSSNITQLPPVIVASAETKVEFDLGVAELTPDYLPDKKEKLSFSRLHSEGNMGIELDLTKNHVMRFREAHPLPVVEEPKSYDRYIVKRVQSASFVEVPRVGMLKQSGCRCVSESQGWRARSVSISSRSTNNNWRSNSRVRLISDSNLHNSLLRLQSHHSSSDEDWFEEVSNDGNVDDSFEPNDIIKVEPVIEDVKEPVFQEISLDEPYEPIQSAEDISIGTVVVDFKTSLVCNKCCPVQCRKKQRLTKSQRDRIKSSNKEIRDSLENVRIDHHSCCSIS